MLSNAKFAGMTLGLGLIVLAVGIGLRFVYLDSDPQYYEWAGYITDEGRWVQYARGLALHGAVTASYVGDLHIVLAPLFQLTHYLIFQIAGVSLLTARLFSAICGSALVVLLWIGLRRRVSEPALLLGLTMVALQPDLVFLSRVAVPEMAVLLFQLVIYLAIVAEGRAAWRLPTAGFALLLACAMKATMILSLPIFLAIVGVFPRRAGDSRPWRDLALFLTGIAVPAVILLVGGYALAGTAMLAQLRTAQRFIPVVGEFLAPAKLYALISFSFDHSVAPAVNPWWLGPWLALLAWRAGTPGDNDFALRRLLATSALWCGLYFVLMLVSDYFPSRYKLHILLPMAICTAAGITLAQRLGMEQLTRAFGRFHSGWLALLTLPTAALLAPWLAWSVAALGADSQRLTTKLLCLVLSQLIVTGIAWRIRDNRRAMALWVSFPILAALVWSASSSIGGSDGFWPTPEAPWWIGAYLVKLTIAIGLSVLLAYGLVAASLTGSVVVSSCAVLYFLLQVVGNAPIYRSPSYTMKEVSRDIGVVLSGYTSIVSAGTETLFMDNPLRYRSTGRGRWADRSPQILVVAFRDAPTTATIETEYSLVKKYKIQVSPEYYRRNRDAVWLDEGGVAISLYRKKSP